MSKLGGRGLSSPEIPRLGGSQAEVPQARGARASLLIESPSSRENYNQNEWKKERIDRKVGVVEGERLGGSSFQEEITARMEKTCGIFPCQKDTIEG